MANVALLERIKKASTIKEHCLVSESRFFDPKDFILTSIPALNLALSGRIYGGLSAGLAVIAGPSRHFKSLLGLMLVKAYLDKEPDGVVLFFDSEFGISPEYLTSMGIATDRVVHIPITNIEELKFEIMAQLEELTKKDKVMIFVDSIGNLASKKEVEDAKDQKSVADMTRAKAFKSLFRIVTPHLTIKNFPMVVINHTYASQGMYPTEVVSGGTGVIYSAQTVIIMGRRQNKEDKELLGYDFILNIEKSRFVKEKSKIPLSVTFDHGVSKWSGLLDIALELGWVTKPSNGWYVRKGFDEKKFREADTNSLEFWKPLLTDKEFVAVVDAQYSLGETAMLDLNTEILEDDEAA